jgi:hypothetical protein
VVTAGHSTYAEKLREFQRTLTLDELRVFRATLKLAATTYLESDVRGYVAATPERITDAEREEVGRLLSRVVSEPTFWAAWAADPRVTITRSGVELSPETVEVVVAWLEQLSGLPEDVDPVEASCALLSYLAK